MSRGPAHYPISKLLYTVVNQSGQGRSGFIKSLDYKSVPHGLRRLDEWLDRGWGDRGVIDRFVRVYHPDPIEFKAILAATAALLAAEEEAEEREFDRKALARFKPYIYGWKRSGTGPPASHLLH